MHIINILLLIVGLRVQRPVRRVSVKRSIFYTLVCKALAGHGKKRRGKRRSGKSKSRKLTFKKRRGR